MQVLKLGLLVGAILLAAHHAKADLKLDQALAKAARKHSVPIQVLRAVATIESSYGKRAVLRKNKNGSYDTGPMQINSVHWNTTCKQYDVSTLQGNANCGALLLSKALKHKADPQAVGRYHSKTPSLKSKYETKVRKILQAEQDRYTLRVSR
jgi:soluble lytic murein transglycosylase-like protein